MSGEEREKRGVLVVDDDADFCASLADVLAGAGYDVTTAATARDALARARDTAPHVFLVDVRLGKDSGTELVQTLAKAEPRSLCVIMTAYAGTDTAIRALKAGAYDYLVKPIEPEDLFATLDRCFERVRLLAENEAARHALEAGNRDLSRLN
ncbi:MAG TPA: response regulator, partial [Spirochaetia bacterium]|nr:response regulator [Spirochaetia bacterium]